MAGLFLCVLIAALAIWAWRNERSREEWRSREADPESLVATADAPFPTGSIAMVRARFLLQSAFPPRPREAKQAIARAIELDPLNSSYWQELAEAHILLGEDEEARAALLRSDELDPNFPAQRLNSIRLWQILGEEERSRVLAVHVGLLGDQFLKGALREMVGLGYSFSEVWDLFASHEGFAGKEAELVYAMREVALSPALAKELNRLIAALPDSVLSDPRHQDELWKFIQKPMVFEAAARFWRLADFAVVDRGGVLVSNAGLEGDPLKRPGGRFGWGWPKESFSVDLAWREAVQGRSGVMAVTFSPEKQKAESWRFYTTPVAAGTTFTVTVPVLQDPAEASLLRLTTQREPKPLEREAHYHAILGQWQDLVLTFPARPEDYLLELTMERKPRLGFPLRVDSTVFIDGLTIRTADSSSTATLTVHD